MFFNSLNCVSSWLVYQAKNHGQKYASGEWCFSIEAQASLKNLYNWFSFYSDNTLNCNGEWLDRLPGWNFKLRSSIRIQMMSTNLRMHLTLVWRHVGTIKLLFCPFLSAYLATKLLDVQLWVDLDYVWAVPWWRLTLQKSQKRVINSRKERAMEAAIL